MENNINLEKIETDENLNLKANREEKKRKGFFRRMGPVRTVLFLIFLCIFLVSAGMLAKNYFVGKAAQDDFTQLTVSGTYDLKALHKQNSDIIGWLQIKDTKINYPIMQTKKSPEYYLRRNFKKEHSIAGTPFMDATSDIDIPTLNWTIYGHNMKNGTMFHDLLKYAKEDFYKTHKTFTFDTIKEKGTYKVVAAFYTQIYDSDYKGFKYYKYNNITSAGSLREYIASSKAIAEYDTGVTVDNEQVLTLSTCAYQVEDGRFVVVAKKIK